MRSLLVALVCAACGHSHEHSSYDTYQACFDEHKNEESLTTLQAIVVCCLDHSVKGANEVCGATAADCQAYLATNLSPTSASGTEVMDSCAEYVRQKGM